jgi:hypothetical protein
MQNVNNHNRISQSFAVDPFSIHSNTESTSAVTYGKRSIKMTGDNTHESVVHKKLKHGNLTTSTSESHTHQLLNISPSERKIQKEENMARMKAISKNPNYSNPGEIIKNCPDFTSSDQTEFMFWTSVAGVFDNTKSRQIIDIGAGPDFDDFLKSMIDYHVTKMTDNKI